MAESPLNIPVYDGSMVSVRSSSSSLSRLHHTGGISRRKSEVQPIWKSGELDSKYQCQSCNNYLRFPIQFETCGHHVCSSCLPDVIRVASRCPTCQQPIAKDQITNDKELEKQIQQLDVHCAYKEQGCDWTGILKGFLVHFEKCGFVSIDCINGCGVKFERRFLTKHRSEDCVKRTIACEFCKTNIIVEDEVPHFSTCLEFKIPCPNQCSTETFPRKQIKDHLENECSKQDVICPFSDCGCEYRANRTAIAEHIKDAPGIHLNMAGKTITMQKALLNLYEERLVEQKLWMELLAKKVNSLEKTYGPQFIWKIDEYQERLQDARTNKKTTLFSPPFLTSRHGYRLSLSLCLWGDGKVRGKYVSLFICINRGEYDSLLVWPFSHQITFTLLDQCEDVNNRRHIIHAIKPNTCKENKPFLGQPVTERNASFGCPKFVDVDTMTKYDYVKDDAIFIKVEVDNEEMVAI